MIAKKFPEVGQGKRGSRLTQALGPLGYYDSDREMPAVGKGKRGSRLEHVEWGYEMPETGQGKRGSRLDKVRSYAKGGKV